MLEFGGMRLNLVEDVEAGWPEPHFERIGGVRTAIYETGEGPPVLLLHGSSICVDARLTWFRLLPELARTHRVISYDQPGFGLSEVPASRSLPDRLKRTDHARELVRTLDLDDCVVIGHSEGGFIATRLALDEPSPVARLIVVTSGATSPALGDARDAAWKAAAGKAYDYVGRSVDEDRLVATEERLARRSDPDFEALLRVNYRRDVATGHVEMFRELGRGRADYGAYTAVQEREVLPFLDRLRAPTTLIWGGADATVPIARGEALAGLIPEARLEVLDGAGHWVMHDAPFLFTETVMAGLV
jgi:pimeloyl-ACP methyl ester carboxylesterase